MMLAGNLNKTERETLNQAERLLELSFGDSSKVSALEYVVDGLLAPDCPLCGRVMLESAVFSGFVDPVLDQEELEKWAVAREITT